MDTETAERPDGRRSWVVAALGTIAMIFTFGTPMSYGIFRGPFGEAFSVSSFALSGVFGVMLFMFFIGSGLIGVFGTRFPARAILLACGLATGALIPALYLTRSVVGLALIFAVLGLAVGTVFVLIASVVPRWFEAKRGAATGLIFVGNGFGLLVLPPLWQRSFVDFGVRGAFLLIVSMTAVSFLLAGIVCRRPRWAEQSNASANELFEWLTTLSGRRSFRLLFAGVAFSFAWYQLLAAYAIDLFTFRGLTAATASAAYGLIGGVSIISRLGVGYLVDVIGARRAYLISLVVTAVGIALLFVPMIPAMLVAIFLTGLGLGAVATVYIPFVMSVYSPERDTAIVGVFNMAAGVPALSMPLLGTASVAYTPGYTLPILLTFLMSVLAIWTIAAASTER